MILTRLRLGSFRCFASPFTVGDFDERITVVHGPNGVGKSTILLALERTLFDRPDSQAAEMEALVPWGSALTPQVTLDLKVGGEAFRLEKSFGPRGQTRIDRLHGREAIPWKEGSAAVEWVREAFGARQPARGASRPEHRGLGQLLFVSQGDLRLPARLGESTVERLRALCDTQAVDPAARLVENELRRRYETHFTAGGQVKKGSPLWVTRTELAEAEAALRAATDDWNRLDQLTVELARAADEVQALELARRTHLADKERLTPEVKVYRQLCEKLTRAESERRAVANAFTALAERIDAIATLRKRGGELDGQIQAVTTTVGDAADRLARAERDAQEQTSLRAEEEAKRASLAAARVELEAAERLGRLETEAASLAARLERAAAASAELALAEETLSRAPGAFSGQRIKELREVLAEERSAREALAALHLRVEARAHGKVEIDGRALAAGEVATWSAAGRIVLRVDDRVTLEIAGPTVDLGAAQGRLERATALADRLGEELGSRDPVTLEVWRAEYKRLQAAAEVAKAKLGSHLGAGEQIADLQTRIAQTAASRAQILADHPAWSSAPPDPVRLAERLVTDEATLAKRFEEVHARDLAAHTEREQLRTFLAQKRDELGTLRESNQAIKGELRLLLSDGKSDAEREAERRALSLARQGAEDDCENLRAALAAFASDPERELEDLHKKIELAGEALSQKRAREARIDAQLGEVALGAPHARLARAEERVAVATTEVARLEAESESIRLLHDLFDEERTSLTAQLIGPVTGRVVPRLKKLYGASTEGVVFDPSFQPMSLRLRGQAEGVPAAALSYGMQDQLALLVRLAIGELAAEKSRLPLVLDDPLVHADRTRLRRLTVILEEVAERLQIIIFTCRPEDYRGLRQARFIDLWETGSLLNLVS